MLVEAVGILAVAAVGGTAAGLHVGDAVGLRAEHAQERLRAHGPGADFHVVRLRDDAAAVGPVFLQLEDGLLEGIHVVGERFARELEQRCGLQPAFDLVLDAADEETAKVGTRCCGSSPFAEVVRWAFASFLPRSAWIPALTAQFRQESRKAAQPRG